MSITQVSHKSVERDEPLLEDESKEDDDVETSEDDDASESDSDSEDEMVRKLNEQLLEDIRRAREASDTGTRVVQEVRKKPAKEEAAIATMKTVLSFAASDPLVHKTLSETLVPNHPGSTVLELLDEIVKNGQIAPQVAGSLSHVLVKLARSEVLFSPLPSLAAESLKRKRDEAGDDTGPSEKRVAQWAP